jgi:hypothetical protein
MTAQQNNPAINKHFKLQIKRLQDAPRGDADNKLEWLLKAKEKENQQATHIEYTERLVTDIQMLEVDNNKRQPKHGWVCDPRTLFSFVGCAVVALVAVI